MGKVLGSCKDGYGVRGLFIVDYFSSLSPEFSRSPLHPPPRPTRETGIAPGFF